MSNILNLFKKKEATLLFPTYGRYPVAIQKGQDYFLYDFSGKKYYDFLSGIAVCILGYNHPEITKVICAQSKKLIHISNLFYQEEQLELATKLQKFAPNFKIFFCNSGAEANEGAIKLVRKYFHSFKKQDRFEIITFSNSFHGRTLATLSATGQDKIKKGFSPLVPGFTILPFNDPEALKKHASNQTAAIMLEVIQGEGGIIPVKPQFVSALKEVCTQNDILLVIDEIQTGMGRTGKFWAHEHFDLKPDIITLAKGLGNGFPIGAVLAKPNIADALGPGSHGTTFGGNALACKVATTVLEIIEKNNLIFQAQEKGANLKQHLQLLQKKFPDQIKEIRGKGLMLGIELKQNAKQIWESLLKNGFILNLTQENVLRLLPPLIIETEAILAFIANLEDILSKQS
ncbi:acetylornithine aminotransferase apoenzyme [Desulfonauticus submarinus]|uniref:Acetylornithine aminotransferase n=1 Tax=Desulfonauticus submarinus TaxID=206665 RepID=A0A1H0BUD2_9BACT|nr:aspartate aminotransferase family protein [Desulfonauticus submarinus]SDN49203.1 acetylornithine aminotransferase apoenzyme [Desulfonauticus submarinus]